MNDANSLQWPGLPGAIDASRLSEEFEAGRTMFADVPISQAHLACLALAAQAAAGRNDCSEPMRQFFREYLGWCAQYAGFGDETRRLLAQGESDAGLIGAWVAAPGSDEEWNRA